MPFVSNLLLRSLHESLRKQTTSSILGITNSNILQEGKSYVTTWCFGLVLNQKGADAFNFSAGLKNQDELLENHLLASNHYNQKLTDWLNLITS